MNLNRKRFKNIFDKHYSELIQLSYKYLGDIDVSQDVVQEVMLELWAKRRRFMEISNLRAYLRRSIVNRSLNYLKKKKVFQIDEENDLQDQATAFHSSIEYEELDAFLRSIIDRLPERCRVIFLLSREEDLSYKQIAQQLNLSPKTIENQIGKALKILKKAYESYKKTSI